MRIVHPKGLEPPWTSGSRITTAELKAWLEQEAPSPPADSRKWKGKAGVRPDLGHSCRSSMEANWLRFLRFMGFQAWTDKGEDPLPGGRWYRYEGQRWEFAGVRGRNSFYIADVEVWPGLVDPGRPYEVHEVKGYLDPDSKAKLNRMARFFPDVPVELITVPQFDEFTRGSARLIPAWEG